MAWLYIANFGANYNLQEKKCCNSEIICLVKKKIATPIL